MVKGLGCATTEESMREYFSKFGGLVWCELKCTQEGKSCGFGFVRYSNSAGQKACLRHSHELDSRLLEVNILSNKYVTSEHPKATRIFVSHLTGDMTSRDIKDYFGKYG
jgi:RNA recognition motif-containing protein